MPAPSDTTPPPAPCAPRDGSAALDGGSLAGGVAILGGSFNPLHNAHLRVAVMLREVLRVERVDFVPAARPPHKPDAGLLPFPMRMAMLETAVARLNASHGGHIAPGAPPPFQVNDLEHRREGPSYTWETVQSYREQEPDKHLLLSLGVNDLKQLHTWRLGFELMEQTTFVIVSRGTDDGLVETLTYLASHAPRDAGRFANLRGRRFEPDDDAVCNRDPLLRREPIWEVAWEGGRALCLGMLRLDLSATLVRALWMTGRSVAGFVPNEVEDALAENAVLVRDAWGQDFPAE